MSAEQRAKRHSRRAKAVALAFGCVSALVILVVGAEIILRRRDPSAGVTVEGEVRTSRGERLGTFTVSPADTPQALKEIVEEAGAAEPKEQTPAVKATREAPEAQAQKPPSSVESAVAPPRRERPRAAGGLFGALAELLGGGPSTTPGQPRRVRSSRFARWDPVLGLRPRPDVQATMVKRKDGRIVFEATYTADQHGRRVTPPPKGDQQAAKALLCFGCSYTFGYGVNDDQTMPARVAAQTTAYQVYNYGLEAAGPQQMLVQLYMPGIAEEVTQKQALAVFTFLHVHISRAVGTPRVLRELGGRQPWFEWDDASQQLVRRGFLFDRRGPRSTATGSKLLDAVEDWYGEKLTKDDAWFTARLIIEAKKHFDRKFESLGFYVLVYPLRDGPLTDHVIGLLKKDGVKILDYRPLLTTKINYDEYFIPDDGHPQPKTHQLMADHLVKDLELQKPAVPVAPGKGATPKGQE